MAARHGCRAARHDKVHQILLAGSHSHNAGIYNVHSNDIYNYISIQYRKVLELSVYSMERKNWSFYSGIIMLMHTCGLFHGTVHVHRVIQCIIIKGALDLLGLFF